MNWSSINRSDTIFNCSIIKYSNLRCVQYGATILIIHEGGQEMYLQLLPVANMAISAGWVRDIHKYDLLSPSCAI